MTLFHITKKRNLSNIKSQGLLPTVFLTEEEGIGFWIEELEEESFVPVVLQVDVTGLPLTK